MSGPSMLKTWMDLEDWFVYQEEVELVGILATLLASCNHHGDGLEAMLGTRGGSGKSASGQGGSWGEAAEINL